jgi:hypothetical protein
MASVGVRLPVAVMRVVDEEAEKRKLTRASFIRQLIEDGIVHVPADCQPDVVAPAATPSPPPVGKPFGAVKRQGGRGRAMPVAPPQGQVGILPRPATSGTVRREVEPRFKT